MTYYFEEKLPDTERFVIPIKNISIRELANMPGRGLDAIGYRVADELVEILLGEAKVSEEQKSPPSVVDASSDSLYKTHSKHKNDLPLVIQRLTDYSRRLNGKDVLILGFAIISLDKKIENKCKITYGCTLVRDFSCVNENADFGKLKSNKNEFDDGKIHFSILSFSNNSIKETVNLFYQKIQEILAV